MRSVFVALALAVTSGCVSVDVQENVSTAPDPVLAAVQSAHLRECPPERVQANARSGSDPQSIGVEAVDIAFTPLASDPTRAVRLRRITVQPGGVIAWHTHTALQGMAILLSGEMTEFRNSCLDPIVHHAGDVTREDADTAHGWRNLSDQPAVILVSHVVVRS
ncbi:cupin domain-containing protein [Terricaulis sp.]|uniref:cupin domain-containing protein n=1 Tax=Terricaulis sp. TaxID=2768686 RepID=UPI0037832570